MTASGTTILCGILVHWHDEAAAAATIEHWPADPRFELIVVDNSSTLTAEIAHGELLTPGANLGYGGAINRALGMTSAPWVLILNADVQPRAPALERLIDALQWYPDAAGLVPGLVGADGRSQHSWQLRPLPRLWQLLGQALMLPLWNGPRVPPPPGTPVEQPAGAALLLRRDVLVELGGFDPDFYPAWFEDVDLALRLAQAGHVLRYCPDAQFVHHQGSSVATLGFTRYLWIHYRNLCRFLDKHHGPAWSLVARTLLVPTCIARLALVPLHRPRRAASRTQAVQAFAVLAGAAISNWRWPDDVGWPEVADDSVERSRHGH